MAYITVTIQNLPGQPPGPVTFPVALPRTP